MDFKFEKYHGLGNDFIFISHTYLKAFKTLSEIKAFVRMICDRRYAIGADGVVFFQFSKTAQKFEILIVNSDGSFAGTCGNALRCLGLKLLRHKLWNGKKSVSIFRLNIAQKNQAGLLSDENFIYETKNSFTSLLSCQLLKPDASVADVSICFNAPKDVRAYEDQAVQLQGENVPVHAVFVQLENPHLVFLSTHFKDFTNEDCIAFGKKMQQHCNANIGLLCTEPNVEQSFSLRVFERGAGFTLACGSGAVAAALALNFTNQLHPKSGDVSNKVALQMPGGSILITLNHQIVLTAQAEFVYHGVVAF